MIGNEAIDPMRTYSATGNEFLIFFLEQFEIPITDVSIQEETTEFQVLSKYIIAKSPLSPVQKGRIVKPGVSVGDYEDNSSPLQNYPNPFSSKTIIKYTIEVPQFVQLKVYDMLGREVAILVSEHLFPGEYEAIWEPRNLEDGVYFYRLINNSRTTCNMMILNR